MMIEEELEIVRGSGNIYADFGDADADIKYLKAHLAAEIIAALDRKKFTAVRAAAATGVAADDILRIRSADLDGFTLDALIRVLVGLDRRVSLDVSDRAPQGAEAAA